MRMPYGEPNFETIRTEGYWYVDKTRYLEVLETCPERYVMLLRSRRFGKSLFCSLLGYYYDRRCADRFDRLFQGLYIHTHPTPKHHAYLMLTFDFSGINTQTLEEADRGFLAEVHNRVAVFLEHYHELFSAPECEQILQHATPNTLLSALFSTLEGKGLGKSVCVIIDEYDHFANNLLSQGKQMFKNLVKTDGYVRPFYEALKKGTKTVVDRLFVTGVMPILLDSLTSGFNVVMNLSIDERFNEMFGFTEAEITPILAALGGEHSREDIRRYYNGYRFNPRATQTVYNSDMILYYALKYNPAYEQLESMIDPNVVSDYRKIRAILSIGEQALEEDILRRIVTERRVTVTEITSLFILTQETEFRFDEQALISLLFYMGYLTIQGRQGLMLTLAMPNLVLESLYFDYMAHVLWRHSQVWIESRPKMEMFQALTIGDPDPLITLTETLLKGLSNRDYERFDEKYIKVVMLSLLSDINIYISRSEYEVSADGYVDLYLQAAFEPNTSAHYFFELKYVKARASKAVLEHAERDGCAAMQRYVSTPAAAAIPNLRAYVLVFRKDRCVCKKQIEPIGSDPSRNSS